MFSRCRGLVSEWRVAPPGAAALDGRSPGDFGDRFELEATAPVYSPRADAPFGATRHSQYDERLSSKGRSPQYRALVTPPEGRVSTRGGDRANTSGFASASARDARAPTVECYSAPEEQHQCPMPDDLLQSTIPGAHTPPEVVNRAER